MIVVVAALLAHVSPTLCLSQVVSLVACVALLVWLPVPVPSSSVLVAVEFVVVVPVLAASRTPLGVFSFPDGSAHVFVSTVLDVAFSVPSEPFLVDVDGILQKAEHVRELTVAFGSS